MATAGPIPAPAVVLVGCTAKASFAAGPTEGGWVEPPQAAAAAPARRAATVVRERMNALRQVPLAAAGLAGGLRDARRALHTLTVPFMCCPQELSVTLRRRNALYVPALSFRPAGPARLKSCSMRRGDGGHYARRRSSHTRTSWARKRLVLCPRSMQGIPSRKTCRGLILSHAATSCRVRTSWRESWDSSGITFAMRAADPHLRRRSPGCCTRMGAHL